MLKAGKYRLTLGIYYALNSLLTRPVLRFMNNSKKPKKKNAKAKSKGDPDDQD